MQLEAHLEGSIDVGRLMQDDLQVLDFCPLLKLGPPHAIRPDRAVGVRLENVARTNLLIEVDEH